MYLAFGRFLFFLSFLRQSNVPLDFLLLDWLALLIAASWRQKTTDSRKNYFPGQVSFAISNLLSPADGVGVLNIPGDGSGRNSPELICFPDWLSRVIWRTDGARCAFVGTFTLCSSAQSRARGARLRRSSGSAPRHRPMRATAIADRAQFHSCFRAKSRLLRRHYQRQE